MKQMLDNIQKALEQNWEAWNRGEKEVSMTQR